MFIPRDVFLDCLKDSPNLDYVMEIKGFSKSTAPVNLYEVMKRLDVLDLFRLMGQIGETDVANFICENWMYRTDGIVACMDGFDYWYPPQVRRDALIKTFIKTRSRKKVREVFAEADVEKYQDGLIYRASHVGS